MRSKLFLILTLVAILVSFLLVGCASGIPQAQYDQLAAQYQDAQSKYAEAQNQLSTLQSQKQTAETELATAQAKIAELQGQVGGLQEQTTLAGATKAETAEKVVRTYHETHVYSKTDMFICGDMSSEVWNMLKAQGISSRIVIGNKDATISDILLSDHAWVLAEVGSGEYLALETTGGYVVPESQNPRYYRGRYFDSPTDLKDNNDLIKEYNVRVGIRNQINDEANAVANKQATSQAELDKLQAVYDKLVELRTQQETELNNIKSTIDRLAKPL